MDPQKIDSILQWPIPKTIRAMRGFRGLTEYYRRSIRNYQKMAQLLTSLPKKSCFVWTNDSLEAFRKSQKAVTMAPILAMPDFSQPFTIECDELGHGKPIAFFCKALADSSLSKFVYEKELMALVLAIQHWRPYLLGKKILGVHRSRERSIPTRTTHNHSKPNWLAKLLGYEFEII